MSQTRRSSDHNGADTNAVQAKVTDANGNVVPNVAVAFASNHCATTTPASDHTDENGLASTTLTNIAAGISKVTATINGKTEAHHSELQSLHRTATSIDGNFTVAT
ncbi:Ig-like domain-containing protein, partial [Hafnia paralvei]|uniref:Ig-like domain-containing protein n=1 Tax=Hafnia paralvei TaxID=546367 RepID=UPI0018F092E7